VVPSDRPVPTPHFTGAKPYQPTSYPLLSPTPHLNHDATRNALGRLRLQCDSQVARLENSVVARVLKRLVPRAVDSQVP
jgi:hypothetical protein